MMTAKPDFASKTPLLESDANNHNTVINAERLSITTNAIITIETAAESDIFIHLDKQPLSAYAHAEAVCLQQFNIRRWQMLSNAISNPPAAHIDLTQHQDQSAPDACARPQMKVKIQPSTVEQNRRCQQYLSQQDRVGQSMGFAIVGWTCTTKVTSDSRVSNSPSVSIIESAVLCLSAMDFTSVSL